MTIIAVLGDSGSNATQATFALYQITGTSIATLKERLASSEFIVVYELFNNDHDEVAQKLGSIIGNSDVASRL